MTLSSITITSETQALFDDIKNPQGDMLRRVVTDMIPTIHDRIHVQGKAADGSQIGTYSDAYMAVRTGKTQKGAQSKSANRYNRSADTKVILSLTRQLENDYSVQPGAVGWGVGFNNSLNFDKATWNNTRYGKVIFDLTSDELDRVVTLTEEHITTLFQ